MRKIEKDMLNAILLGVHWKVGNTEVVSAGGVSEVFLHGNHLGTWVSDKFSVNKDTIRKYPSVTTKSRLRALGVDVYTRKGVTYLGSEAITD